MLKTILPDLNKARLRTKNKVEIIRDLKLTTEQKKIGKNLSFFVQTFGCQANERDGETIQAILLSIGFKSANKVEEADLVILNTCAIRQNAEDRVFGHLSLLKRNKQINKLKYFGICGCMPQQEKVVRELQQKVKNIDFVFGTHNIVDLPKILVEVIKNKNKVVQVIAAEGKIYEQLPDYRTNNFKAYVNIMYGCDHFCSYCIVPFTRGKIRSRLKKDVLDEVLFLKKQGYKEITLLGQNVNSYGIDFKNKNYKFIDLLEDVAKTGVERIKFVTSNPWNFDEKIIDLINKYDNLMPYIHLPIQSGNNEILKLMNRRTDINQYIKLVKKIRSSIENVSITTDIIVGYPNETKKQFKDTLKMYKKLKFDNAYTFVFSPREGTVAAKINDEISLEEKQKRLQKLNKLVRKYSKFNNNKYIGEVVKVLVEGPSKNQKDVLTGYAMNWKLVNFTGNAKPGEVVLVKITSSSLFSLNGFALKPVIFNPKAELV